MSGAAVASQSGVGSGYRDSRSLYVCRLCRALQLPGPTRCTALGLLHRARAVSGWEQIKVLEGACVMLGFKLTDEKRKVRDVVNCVHLLEDIDAKPFEIDEATGSLGSGYWAKKEALLQAEHDLLCLLNFNVKVMTPHNLFLQHVFVLWHVVEPESKRQNWATVALAWLQDCFLLPDVERLDKCALSCACIARAAREVGCALPVGPGSSWQQALGCENDELYEQMVERLEGLSDETSLV